jgi:hypothetical protein
MDGDTGFSGSVLLRYDDAWTITKINHMETLMNDNKINENIALAKMAPAGTRIVYYTGELGRHSHSDKNDPDWKRHAYVGEAFYNLYLDGYVALVQKPLDKIGTFDGKPYRAFEYIAVVLPAEGREKRSIDNWFIFNSMRQKENPYTTRKLA